MTHPRPPTPALAATVQDRLIEGLGGEAEQRLADLGPCLAELRQAYSRTTQPDFSVPGIRQAYLFASHPHHCFMTAAALSEIHPDDLGLRDGEPTMVTVLGAGPAAELVGLAWYLAAHDILPDPLAVHLVDREPGWQATRSHSLAVLADLLGDRRPELVEHTIDILEPDDALTGLLGRSDLVIAQALYSEVPDDSAIDHLLGHLGARTRLLIIEPPSGRGVVARIDHERLRPVHVSGLQLPPPAPHQLARDHLFAEVEFRRPRRRALDIEVRLLARPGTPPPRQRGGLKLSRDQSAALDAFDAFLETDRLVFRLRGPAGTGKSALFPHLADLAARHDLAAVQLAPTGQAARRLHRRNGPPASTIHSHLYTHHGIEPRGDDRIPLTRFVRRRTDGVLPALLFVDEASMIGDTPFGDDDSGNEVVFGEGRLLADLVTYARETRSRLVFAGDADQLPPVGEPTCPVYDDDHLAELRCPDPTDAVLTTAHREHSGTLLGYARHLLITPVDEWEPPSGDPTGPLQIVAGHPAAIEPWLRTAVLDGDAVVVCPTNGAVSRWNTSIRERAGRDPDGPVPGDRLLVTRTDHVTGYLNGQELDVEEVGPAVEILTSLSVKGGGRRDHSVTLRRLVVEVDSYGLVVDSEILVVAALDGDDLLAGTTPDQARLVGRVLLVDFITRTGIRPSERRFEDCWNDDERAHALRAAYAYARTAHRAQGGEWANVIVDFDSVRSMTDPGRWAYTAITRARQAVYLAHFPRRRTPLSPADLVEWARAHLPPGTEIIDSSELNGGLGVSLTVGDGRTVCRVAVYQKGGRVSSVVSQGSPSDLRDRVRTALAAAIDESVLDQSREVAIVEPLARRLEELGVSVSTERCGEYQIRIHLDGDGRKATAVVTHNARGRLTGLLGSSLKGDDELLGLLHLAWKAIS